MLKVTTGASTLVLKRFAPSATGTLFPNLPDDEARALGLPGPPGVAPRLLGYWPDQALMACSFVEGDQWHSGTRDVARLLLRKEAADPSGFRKVPTDPAAILAKGDALFARCTASPAAVRPVPVVTEPPARLSLIHTDLGASNLIGAGAGLRIIDWQCPAAGDLAEDIYSFLAPGFHILNLHATLTPDAVAEFWAALARAPTCGRATFRCALVMPGGWRPIASGGPRPGPRPGPRRTSAPAIPMPILPNCPKWSSPMLVDPTIHSFSLWHHFAHKPGFGAIAYADLAADLGFRGISLSLNNPDYRHLGGRETWRMDQLRTHLAGLGFSLEVDTSGTDPAHMTELLQVARRMGATSLRTYTRHGGSPDQMMAATIRDLAAVAPVAGDLGIVIVLENHEDFTGPELARIVQTVGHPALKILHDYGNSQMVLEDPEAALEAVLPYVHSVHFKDHVMVRPEVAGRLTVAGVPVGEGFLPLDRITRRLLDQGLRQITFENVRAYSAGIKPGRKPQPGVTLGEGSFAYLEPPHNPARIVLDQSGLAPDQLVELEHQALSRGVAAFRAVLERQGCSLR